MSYIYKTGRIELLEQIKKHSSFIKGRVLDIGSGNFPRYKHLFTFSEYISMDIQNEGNVNLFGKIEKIPSPDNSFDSILCTQVLGDVFDLEKAFSEMFRVLKPGGNALITESLFDPIHDEPNDFWRFTSFSLQRLAENVGFEVIVNEKRGGFFSVLAQLKARYWIERLNASKKWYARGLSFYFKIIGSFAKFLDKKDKSRANKIFTHGYLVIAHKNA